MKIAWVYPIGRRCGISAYAQNYLRALRTHVETVAVDCADILSASRVAVSSVNLCDIAHIQYETSLFLNRRSDHFPRLCQAIKPPRLVSLHEVYRRFPGVFPRQEIAGRGAVHWLKLVLYDFRHPSLSAFERHRRKGFFARAILVHHDYHRQILVEQGLDGARIHVLRHPVPPVPAAVAPVHSPDGPVLLGAAGFVNPNYDYNLLFDSLAALRLPWRFTWIGGPRRPEDQALAADIVSRVAQRGWSGRFTVTGWLPDEEFARRLEALDVFCALFTDRSSSGSLSRAIGARRPIVATPLPLVEEIAARAPVLRIAQPDPAAVAEAIRAVACDENVRREMCRAAERYGLEHSYEAMSLRLVTFYRSILNQ